MRIRLLVSIATRACLVLGSWVRRTSNVSDPAISNRPFMIRVLCFQVAPLSPRSPSTLLRRCQFLSIYTSACLVPAVASELTQHERRVRH